MLSHKQTEREVKRFTGNTFVREMSKRKIEAAVILSQTTNLSLTEISELVGYTSYCGFYKAYKNMFHNSPKHNHWYPFRSDTKRCRLSPNDITTLSQMSGIEPERLLVGSRAVFNQLSYLPNKYLSSPQTLKDTKYFCGLSLRVRSVGLTCFLYNSVL